MPAHVPVLKNLDSVLLVRRDNIGDLVCTTPLLGELRRKFPSARLDVLANSYNAPILENHPDVDHLYAYVKNKHRPIGMTVLGALWRRMVLLLRLRHRHYDLVILGQDSYQWQATKFAWIVKPQHILGYIPEKSEEQPGVRLIDCPVKKNRTMTEHTVLSSLRLLEPLGIKATRTPLKLALSAAEENQAQALRQQLLHSPEQATDEKEQNEKKTVLGIHISARLPGQRWPVAQFVELIQALAQERKEVVCVLFWSPGPSENPLHPGDDAKAVQIQQQLAASGKASIHLYPTKALRELLIGLAAVDLLVCSDGGAMHMAAALQKPLICFFGETDPVKWHPWQVQHILLQPPSKKVTDISVVQVLSALNELLIKYYEN